MAETRRKHPAEKIAIVLAWVLGAAILLALVASVAIPYAIKRSVDSRAENQRPAPPSSTDLFEHELRSAMEDFVLTDPDIDLATMGFLVRRIDRTPDLVVITLVEPSSDGTPERCRAFEVPLPIVGGGVVRQEFLDRCPPAG